MTPDLGVFGEACSAKRGRVRIVWFLPSTTEILVAMVDDALACLGRHAEVVTIDPRSLTEVLDSTARLVRTVPDAPCRPGHRDR